MLSFIGDFFIFVNVYHLKTRSKVTTKFIEYQVEMELRKSKLYKRTMEYNSRTRGSTYFCRMNGIIYQKESALQPAAKRSC